MTDREASDAAAAAAAAADDGAEAPIYLDYNATTPVLREVGDAMVPYIYEHFGNPSSSHLFGRRAAAGVSLARRQVAGLLGCDADEVVFMSCATETINYALKGAAEARRAADPACRRLVTSAVEHPATSATLEWLERERGFEVVRVPVDAEGLVDERAFEAAVTPGTTALCTVMLANNEVGAVQRVAWLARAARERCPGVLFHTDASQGVGKVPARVRDLGVDLLTVAGHKIYAPKGVGALYVRRGTPPLPSLVHGAGHEGGRRAGTESVVLVVGLGAACEAARRDFDRNVAHLAAMRDRLEAAVLGAAAAAGVEARVNGPADPARRLPNTLSVGLAGVVSGRVQAAVEDRLACSAGAACHEGVKLSHVLQAMKVPRRFALGTLRLSVGVMTTADEVDRAAALVVEAAARLREA